MKTTLFHRILLFVRSFIVPFSITMFIIFSMMYYIPGLEPFRPEWKWPFSAIKWIADFILLKPFFGDANLYYPWIVDVYFWNTLKFLLGSLVLSAVIVSILLYFRFNYNTKLFRVFLGLLNISSGFHILILGSILSLYSQRIDNPLDIRLLFILALGNGSLIELYNTLEAEFENIFKKEYVLAGVAWGFSKIRFPLREIFLTMIDFLNARIPILLSSTIVLEFMFSLDGLSYNILMYISKREYLNILLVSALFSVIVLFSNMLVDIFHYYLDPRIRDV